MLCSLLQQLTITQQEDELDDECMSDSTRMWSCDSDEDVQLSWWWSDDDDDDDDTDSIDHLFQSVVTDQATFDDSDDSVELESAELLGDSRNHRCDEVDQNVGHAKADSHKTPAVGVSSVA